jgi:predicted ATPase/DNA-binding SARP family transcriptional activator
MLEIRFLGRFDIGRDGSEIDIGSRPARLLFAYLILTRGSMQPREMLAGVLWPESTESSARKNLRQALWRLRQVIGEENLIVEPDSIGFDKNSDYWLDIEELEMPGGSDPEKSVMVYEGELLPGYYEEWILLERDRLASVYNRKMQQLIESVSRRQDWEQLIDWSERWIARGDYPEAGYRALMTAYGCLGDLSSVEATYQRCVDAMDAHVGVPPSAETTDIYEQFLAGEFVLPAPRKEAPASTFEMEDIQQSLPTPATNFIGRKRELAELREQFQDTRILTIVGPGGIGKSRLALQFAAELSKSFIDGCYFVSLAPITGAESIIQTIAEVLKFPLATNEAPNKQLFRFLRGKELLLIMDNFEHLLVGVDLIGEIITSAPGVKVLATSRERLNLQGESIYSLQGLGYQSAADSKTPSTDAFELFLYCAKKIHPGLQPTPDQIRVIGEICKLVQGMPLAIELAAAWLHVLSIEEVFGELVKGLDLLETEVRDTPERHRSIRTVFNHSWSLLSEEDKKILCALSLFRGGFTREAAQAVTGSSFKSLAGLVNKSLLSHDIETNRFEIHELLRQFSKERLDERPDLFDAAEAAHADFFGEFMSAKWAELRSRKQVTAISDFKADIENIRTAWRYYLDRLDARGIWQFINGFWLFYWILWMNHAGEELFSEAVGSLSVEQSKEIKELQAVAMGYQAFFMGWLERPQEGYDLAKQSVAVLEQADLPAQLLIALESMAVNAYFLGQFLEEFSVIERIAKISPRLDDPWLGAFTAFPIGMAAVMQAKFADAERIAKDKLLVLEDLGDEVLSTMQLIILGHAELGNENLESAREYYLKSLSQAERVNFYYSIQTATKYLAKVNISLGNVEEARRYLCRSLSVTKDIGFLRDIVNLIFEYARLKVSMGDYVDAIELLALVIDQPVSRRERLFDGRILDSAENLLTEVERKVDASTFTEAYQRGQQMNIDKLVTDILSEVPF